MARRKSHTAAYKLEAVKFSLVHGSAAAARHFEVDGSLIRKWRTEKENLQKLPSTKRARRFGRPKVEEIEEALYTWIVQRRAANRAVFSKDIEAEALDYHRN
ncbi:hypothetical protein Q1695_003315 [Nippostrongylus brasiliensis]|nr:hypothetical protein Q1695_003315 [Nippostrongylus brasiliensis]